MLLVTLWCFLTLAFAHDDGGLVRHPICEILIAAKYPCEDHPVVTEDGFVLGVIRIPAREANARAVILQHGLLDSGATWVLNSPEESLGFILHREGWDVWLGNSRGNTYSRNHTKLEPDNVEYWNAIDFSTMAQFDLPALVNYILQNTSHKTVAYVGHSQGTTQMFAALSNNYGGIQEKISVFIALSPVAYVHHIGSVPMQLFAESWMPETMQKDGNWDFLPNEEIYSKVGIICKLDITALGCKLVPLLLCGANMSNLDASRFSYYLKYSAAGTSTHNMCHWAQHVREERFGLFDWDKQNGAIYHQPTPPQYDVSQISVPVALFTGGADTLAVVEDVNVLSSRIETVVYTNFQPDYGHMDYIWGVDAHKRIYCTVQKVLARHLPDGEQPPEGEPPCATQCAETQAGTA